MADKVKTEETTKEKKSIKKDYIHAVGRRKESVARVRLYHSHPTTPLMWGDLEIKKGSIIVNGKPIEQYFSTASARAVYEKPFRTTNTLGKITITIKVLGGGTRGQLDAVVHGIARALTNLDSEKHRIPLKKKGLLTRDARAKERRKVGTGGKARRQKPHPKR